MTSTRDEWSINPTVQHIPAGNGYTALDGSTTLYDLSSDPNNLYIGYGTQGADPSGPGWTIRRIALTGGSPSNSQWTAKGAAVWNNRASESYL